MKGDCKYLVPSMPIVCFFKIEPSQVSDLRVSFVGVTQVAITWKNGNDTATCWMLLEGVESCKELPQVLVVNIPHLTPGVRHKVTLCLSESNEEGRESSVTDSGLGELQKCHTGFDFQ